MWVGPHALHNLRCNPFFGTPLSTLNILQRYCLFYFQFLLCIMSCNMYSWHDMLHLIFGTSFLNHSGFLIRIIQRPSFEHAGPTCYTLLSPSITFSLFYSELNVYLFRKSYSRPYSVSVCRTDLMAVDRLLDLLAYRFLCFSYIFLF